MNQSANLLVLPVKSSMFSYNRIGNHVRVKRSVDCTQTLFYFSFRFFSKTSVCARASFFPHPYPFALAVNKSPAVYILSRALDWLWRENRGTVNRLKARGRPRGRQMPEPRATQNLLIPLPKDRRGRQMPRSGVGGGWAQLDLNDA